LPSINGKNCFGLSGVDSGHIFVPVPPQINTKFMLLMLSLLHPLFPTDLFYKSIIHLAYPPPLNH